MNENQLITSPEKMTSQCVRDHSFVAGANLLNEFCAPLFRLTPINFFEPICSYQDNSYSGLMSDGKWAEHYLKNGYYNIGIKNFQKNYIKNDFVIWSNASMFNVNDRAQKLYQDCVDHNYGNGISIIEHTDGAVYTYNFGAPSNSARINEFLLSNIDLLDLFILSYKAKLKKDKQLRKVFELRYQTAKEECSMPSHEGYDELEQYYPLKRYYISQDNNLYLTASELRCISYYFKSSSMKKSALLLNISPRTVETHLNSVKLKLGCISLYNMREILCKDPILKRVLQL